MNTDTYSDEDIPAPTPDEYDFTSSGGGMFAGSQYFTIAGGTFNNIMNAAPTVPPDFRMIPIGDIDLRKELVVNRRSSTIGHGLERNCVRRVYSAKIEGRRSKATVAVYEGNGAEEDWRRDTEMYMSVRHPNVIQICGGASYGNIHATVFHGDLIPLKVFLAPHSPIITVYLYAFYSAEWSQVYDHFQWLGQIVSKISECMMWIRTSTGQLSADIVSPNHFVLHLFREDLPLPPAVTPLNVTDIIAIKYLGLAQYHDICSWYLTRWRDDSVSTSATVHIGAVTSWPSGHRYEEHVEIALLPVIDSFYVGWQMWGDGEGNLMGNGWTRYRADDIFKTRIILWVYSDDPGGWLSQANHVFNRLQITSNLKDYTFVGGIYFTVAIGSAGQDPPPGHLFLCPKGDIRTGAASFRWPKCPAYWSLDPSGVERLSTEEAARLGLPPFQLTTEIQGKAWDDGVYAGLRTFHQAKGFDPDSQDVARHLGYPFYKLPQDVNSPFAHVDDFTEAEATAEDADTEDEWADAQSSLHEDSDCDEGSDAEDGVGEARICGEPQAPGVDQELMDGGYTDTNHEANLKSQTANGHLTGEGLIHRMFGALRHSLVVEVDSDNIDSDPISPFLI